MSARPRLRVLLSGTVLMLAIWFAYAWGPPMPALVDHPPYAPAASGPVSRLAPANVAERWNWSERLAPGEAR